jgi:hypothetical protein
VRDEFPQQQQQQQQQLGKWTTRRTSTFVAATLATFYSER